MKKLRKGKLLFKIPTETILEIKKDVVDRLVKEYNTKHSYKDNTGNLRNSVGWREQDGKIYIIRGMGVITVI